MHYRVLGNALIGLACWLPSFLAFGQSKMEGAIEQVARSISGTVGVHALVLETGETLSYHADQRFPMQSVYKFPIAMAVLDRVDEGALSLDQTVHVQPSDYIPEEGYSPIREKFPEGVDLSVRDLIRYSVTHSDGSASDMLLKLIGGAQAANAYVHDLGVKDMAIATTEMVQVANDTIQYQNWSTPGP